MPALPRWVADWERLVRMMVEEPYLRPRLDPDTGALRGFLEAPAELQVRGRQGRGRVVSRAKRRPLRRPCGSRHSCSSLWHPHAMHHTLVQPRAPCRRDCEPQAASTASAATPCTRLDARD